MSVVVERSSRFVVRATIRRQRHKPYMCMMVSIILLKSFSCAPLSPVFSVLLLFVVVVVDDAEFATDALTTEQNNIYFSNPPLTWQRPLCFSAFLLRCVFSTELSVVVVIVVRE